MTAKTLDPQFADLVSWVQTWALDSEGERLATRAATAFPDLRLFYDALAPRMDAIVAHLDATPLRALSDDQKTLFELAQSFFEVSLAVELLQEPDEATMLPPARLNVDVESGVR